MRKIAPVDYDRIRFHQREKESLYSAGRGCSR
nr:MAG TPA: hypothetical protein [Caudoviricetes sp.]